MKSVLFAGLYHETHTFLSVPTTLADFKAMAFNAGEDAIGRNLGNGSPSDGFLTTAREKGWRIIPTIQMAAMPGGPVTDEAIAAFDDVFFDVLERESPFTYAKLVRGGATSFVKLKDGKTLVIQDDAGAAHVLSKDLDALATTPELDPGDLWSVDIRDVEDPGHLFRPWRRSSPNQPSSHTPPTGTSAATMKQR